MLRCWDSWIELRLSLELRTGTKLFIWPFGICVVFFLRHAFKIHLATVHVVVLQWGDSEDRSLFAWRKPLLTWRSLQQTMCHLLICWTYTIALSHQDLRWDLAGMALYAVVSAWRQLLGQRLHHPKIIISLIHCSGIIVTVDDGASHHHPPQNHKLETIF